MVARSADAGSCLLRPRAALLVLAATVVAVASSSSSAGTVAAGSRRRRVGPRADWSHVPIMYFSGSHTNRSDAEIEVLARFDIVAVNKEEMPANASCINASSSTSWQQQQQQQQRASTPPHCGQELRQIETLRRVKARNPSVFTMAYMNTMMNFASQAIAPRYSDDLLISDVNSSSSGRPFMFHGDGWRPGQGADVNAVAAFNLALPAAREI
jgi:hypothetical protein